LEGAVRLPRVDGIEGRLSDLEGGNVGTNDDDTHRCRLPLVPLKRLARGGA
jgi:hypothetical protein